MRNSSRFDGAVTHRPTLPMHVAYWGERREGKGCAKLVDGKVAGCIAWADHLPPVGVYVAISAILHPACVRACVPVQRYSVNLDVLYDRQR